GCEEFLFRADVVDRDLRDVRRGRASDSHTVLDSVADMDRRDLRTRARATPTTGRSSRYRIRPATLRRIEPVHLAATVWAQERTSNRNYPTAPGEQITMRTAGSLWGPSLGRPAGILDRCRNARTPARVSRRPRPATARWTGGRPPRRRSTGGAAP